MKLLIVFFLFINYINANQKITLQLNWLHQYQFAGYYMAKEKGFYKDAGIDVDIKELKFGMNALRTIEEKKADFAIGRSSLLIDKAKGKDIVALLGVFQDSPLVLVVKKDSGIKRIEDLKNKKVMITEDARGTASILAMLSSKKIFQDDFIVQKHSFNLDDLISNKTDAMASYLSNEPTRLENKGIEYTVFDPKVYGFNFYSDILFTSSDFIDKNDALTKSFYKATIQGWKYAFDNIGKTAQLIHSKYNTQNKSFLDLVSEAEVLKKLAYTDLVKEIGCLEKDKLQDIVNVYKVMGLMEDDIDLDEFVYEHNNHTILNLKLTKSDLIENSVIAIVILLVFTFVVVHISIRNKWLLTTEILKEEIELKTQQLKKQTYFDALTGARNRKSYEEKIREYLSLSKRYNNQFSFIYFDIDDFKKVNDTYGHKVGDKVLIELVEIVSNQIRANDYLFRIGGEEFVVLLSETQLEPAKIVAENMRKNVENKLTSMDEKAVTISLGLTQSQENDTEESIYTRADKLVYISKKQGKNQTSF